MYQHIAAGIDLVAFIAIINVDGRERPIIPIAGHRDLGSIGKHDAADRSEFIFEVLAVEVFVVGGCFDIAVCVRGISPELDGKTLVIVVPDRDRLIGTDQDNGTAGSGIGEQAGTSQHEPGACRADRYTGFRFFLLLLFAGGIAEPNHQHKSQYTIRDGGDILSHFVM